MSSHIDVAIRDLQPQMVAYISKKGPYSGIQGAFGTLFGWLGQKGLVPAGPPSGAYFNAPGEVPEDCYEKPDVHYVREERLYWHPLP